MDSDWYPVFETADLHEAHLVKSFLESQRIPTVLLNQKDSTYISLGDIRIYVQLEHASDATMLLSDLNG